MIMSLHLTHSETFARQTQILANKTSVSVKLYMPMHCKFRASGRCKQKGPRESEATAALMMEEQLHPEA